jgi:hypothetical protein
MTLAINLKLLTTQPEMLSMISGALAVEINKRIKSRLDVAKTEIQAMVKKRLIEAPEYKSLMGDSTTSSLRAHFGLISPISVVTPIIETWLNNIKLEHKEFKGVKTGKLKGSLKLSVIKSSYLDVKSLPTASYTSKPSNHLIPWLEWLLESGTTLLIKDYGITFDINEGSFQGLFRSRSGQAIMVGSKDADNQLHKTFGLEPLKGSFSWSVPPEYAGTKNDNWVTRALVGIEPQISKIFAGMFE